MKLDNTGERMVPEFHRGQLMYAEHLIRYKGVQDLVRGKVVLDIASGSGYGTALLAETAQEVYGLDASRDAVDYAQHNFGAENIRYMVADAIEIPLDENSVDIVVTFETIEHVENYEKFLSEISRVLKPDGLAVVSTPNDLEFAEGNHFHLHEFEKEELLGLLGKYFKNIDEYYQATWKYVAIDKLKAMQRQEIEQKTLNVAPLKEEECLYFYFVCSNRKITEQIEPIAAIGEHYSDRALMQVNMAHESELGGLRGRIDHLESELRHCAQQAAGLTSELTAIKTSRAFRAARKLAAFKKRLGL